MMSRNNEPTLMGRITLLPRRAPQLVAGAFVLCHTSAMDQPSNSPRSQGLIGRLSKERRAALNRDIEEMSRPRLSFYAMVVVSTTIAAYGLLANSTAIVIGAMLVAPLMGPIFGVALGLSSGENRMLRQSGVSEAVGVLLAVATAFVIGHLPLRADFGPEIVARTQPTLYDVVVAIASGLAGAYALTNERISPALPGVAISTSLVPPLATCGLCLSAGLAQPALGAFLLFFANFLAIEIASAAVFVVFGVVSPRSPVGHSFGDMLRRFGVSIVMLVVVGVFMTHTLIRIIEDRRLTAGVQEELSHQLRSILGAQLSDVDVHRRRDALRVAAVVLTPQQIEPSLVARIEDGLRKQVDPRIGLVVRSLISADADRNGPVYLADEIKERQAKVKEQTEFLTKATKTLNAQMSHTPGAKLVDLRREMIGKHAIITAVVRAPEPIKPPVVGAMENALREAVGTPVHLTVRCVITRDADSTGYLYEKEKPTKPLPGTDPALTTRLDGALRRQLARQITGAELSEFSYDRTNGRLVIRADARAPRVLTPFLVRRVERELQRYVDPSIVLIVHTSVEADAASSGYVRPR